MENSIQNEFPKRMTEEQLKQFVLDYTAGKIFTNRHLGENDVKTVTLVFMPLTFADFSGVSEEQFSNVSLIWEHIDKAGSTGINGCPMFFSCNLMHKEDFERVKTAVLKEEERRKNIEV